jgi:threonine aldolase
VRLLPGNRGRLTLAEVKDNINNEADVHQPITSVLALENTVVREAGSYYTLDQIASLSAFARTKGLKMHLDGARLFNALTVTGDRPTEIGSHFDTISICLSKGLGAPVGSVLVCKKEFARQARRIRKAFGGGMRQAGYLAAAGIYALDHHVGRLAEDHTRARQLGLELGKQPWVKSLMPVDTNIIIFEVDPPLTPEIVLGELALKGVKAVKFGPQQIRMVTHLDFTDDHLDKIISVLKNVRF